MLLVWLLPPWITRQVVADGHSWISRSTVPTQIHECALLERLHAAHCSFSASLFLAVVYYIFRNNWIWRTHQAFNTHVRKVPPVLRRVSCKLALRHRLVMLVVFIVFVGLSCLLVHLVGRDFFPTVDAGPASAACPWLRPGTRLEESERYFAQVEKYLRTQIPADEVDVMLDNIGIPNSGINMSLSDGSPDLAGRRRDPDQPQGEPSPDCRLHEDSCARNCPQQFPDLGFWFQPADIATQVLNFGIPAPIDVQIVGTRHDRRRRILKIAEELRRQISRRARARSTCTFTRSTAHRTCASMVDRTRGDQIGVAQKDVANSVLVSLSSSGQTAPNYWLDPTRGVSYSVSVMTPQYKIEFAWRFNHTPIVAPGMTTRSFWETWRRLSAA